MISAWSSWYIILCYFEVSLLHKLISFAKLLKMLSKPIRILRITSCYTQLCGRCLLLSTHDSSSQGGNTFRICNIIIEIH